MDLGDSENGSLCLSMSELGLLVTNLSDIYLCPPLHALFDEDFLVFMGLGFAIAGLNERFLFRDFSATVVSSVWWCVHM